MPTFLVQVLRSSGAIVKEFGYSSKYAAKKQARRLADEFGDSFRVLIVKVEECHMKKSLNLEKDHKSDLSL